MCTYNLCFKISKKILLKIFNFYNFRKSCILHGRVFVMKSSTRIQFSYYHEICTRFVLLKKLSFSSSSLYVHLGIRWLKQNSFVLFLYYPFKASRDQSADETLQI